MSAELTTYVAFHLTGRRAAADLGSFDPLALRPALFAGYRDLTTLRYDFPLVLVRHTDTNEYVQSLSGLIDDLLSRLNSGADTDRVRAHVLRLEREIRTIVAQGTTGLLSDLWRTAADRLGVRADAPLKDSLDRARAALDVDGEVVDCDRAMPARLLSHAWQAINAKKASRLREEVTLLVAKLADVLRADFVRSDAGRSPANLKAAVGTLHETAFDFEALSRILSESAPKALLSDARRTRIQSLIAALESQPFYPDSDEAAHPNGRREPFRFVFETCSAAQEAYRARLPRLVAVAKAIGMAELEARGEYNEARHDTFFEELSAADLSPQDLALFPDYLVIANAGTMTPADHAALTDLLSSDLPIKAVVQSDDLSVDPAAGVGVRQRQFATMAIGLNNVYVLQAAASQLYQDRARVLRGFSYLGPAVFSIYSGDTGTPAGLPPYLIAAAAMESRAFPSIVYDPSAGPDWASRCDLEANPQVDLDWPVQPLAYEDRDHQRQSDEVAFTIIDFLACDARFATHFAPVPNSAGTAGFVSASTVIAGPATARPDRVPFVWMIDGHHALRRVLVDDKLIREARKCREMWHSLQELGGINNSHAARVLARERREAEARALAAAPVGATPVGSLAPAAAAAPSQAAVVAEPEAAPERAAGEPYIETPRCSSCNECIQLNSRMFAYNENRQASIVNPDAGTFRQLVEAAESCQVSIIHPGKPRNPDETGLEELLERAAAFS